MRLRAFISTVVVSVVAACFLYACGDDSSDNACADGSTKVGSRCTEEDSGTSTPHAGTGGSKPPPTGGSLSCGEGTVMRNGKCVVADGGSTTPPPAPSPVGSGCKTDDDCADGTTCLIDAKLPGGLCTIAGCDMTHPCPTGAYCNRVTKGFNICMPYCQDDSSCRTDEGYVCQSLYTNAINICAPPCSVSGACTSGTNCNAKTGLCELAECDPNASTSGCKDTQTCWADTQNLSSKGGLCLVLCDPNNPKATCKVDEKDEVCQPLAADPANTGFCAPPVCAKTEDCPAGALCQNNVCQPPALCDSNGACDDDSTTCVSGVCMPKCPTGAGDACSDIHPGLTCASVLDVPACLPVGSFPGSECRPNRDDACSDLALAGGSAPMVCENNTCLVDCTNGGQDLCSGIDDSLLCASGIFDKPLCLPAGAFPGGPCGANDSCAQDLQGNSVVDMKCVSGTCVIDCDESSHWSGYGDALCSIVDPTLTCANAAGSICVRACGSAGACDNGFSCLDAGSIGTHENSCLPTGSFPGSPCASGPTPCSALPGGLTQSCVNGTCVVDCGGGATAVADDAICNAVDPSLTCSESAGDICVRKCNGSTCADAGFSCLNPGTEGACLPTGSFPGSPCRSGADKCDVNLSGNAAVDMKCVEDTCVVDCNTAGTTSQDDGLCAAVSPVLTCTESAGNICVLKCNNGNCVQPGFSCLVNGGENACLPTGSFPSSPCIGGTTCLDLPGGITQTCVQGQCLADCDGVDDTTTCPAVDPSLVCSEAAGNHCVIGCVSGECEGEFSCLTNAGENACLPNGTFPGATCREGNTPCDSLTVQGLGTIDMKCAPGVNVCAPSCAVGLDPDGLCDALGQNADPPQSLTCLDIAEDPICVPACGDNGECADGFSCFTDEQACLPNGSFPGSACDSAGLCGTGMDCVNDTVCLVTCNTGDEDDNDDLCGAVDPRLTCAEDAGHHCFLACDGGECDDGFSCLGGDNACLPTGSFPGSPCADGDTCGTLPGGLAMQCNPQSHVCVVPCAGNDEQANDGLCHAVNSTLTCSESAGHICVRACNQGGTCDDAGFSCLNPLSEAACLPNGSFPGSACATGNLCAPVQSGAGTTPQDCIPSAAAPAGQCVPKCVGNVDATCTNISPLLTCSSLASEHCVLSCKNTECGAGYSCLDKAGEAECLPNGTFPGSTCGAGDTCGALPGPIQMVCNTQNPANHVCVVPCQTGQGEVANDGLCQAVSNKLTCSESAGHVCVAACNAQHTCDDSNFSCLSPGTEAACLPNGSFPYSTCAANNVCAPARTGVTTTPQSCQQNVCVPTCPGPNESTCTNISPALTCANTPSLCVPSCKTTPCPTGLSCFDQAGEAECLPNGSFPGSTCATGDVCGSLPGPLPMQCNTQNPANHVCVVPCQTGQGEVANDGLCQQVSSILTCSETAGHVCVAACNQSNTCDAPGFSCLSPGGEKACLPNGTFPGSACAQGTTCFPVPKLTGGTAEQVCVPGPVVCAVSCPDGLNATCTAVDPSLICSNTICIPD